MMRQSVVQPWISELPWMQQTVVLCALRGCDGLPKEDASKRLVRGLRAAVLHNARPVTDFMGVPSMEDLIQFVGAVDHYPLHWFTHFMHAAEIIGYNHPTPLVQEFWHTLYVNMANAIHLNPETKEELNRRLNV